MEAGCEGREVGLGAGNTEVEPECPGEAKERLSQDAGVCPPAVPVELVDIDDWEEWW